MIANPALNSLTASCCWYKEVVERLYAQPGSSIWSPVGTGAVFAECELICPVPAEYFYPQPKVDSAVVRLRPRKLSLAALDLHRLETLIKLGFAAKRKMLRNNLKG